MKIKTKVSQEHLLLMLMATGFQQAVTSFNATAPNHEMSGMVGCSEVDIEFNVRDLSEFTRLFYLTQYKSTKDFEHVLKSLNECIKNTVQLTKY